MASRNKNFLKETENQSNANPLLLEKSIENRDNMSNSTNNNNNNNHHSNNNNIVGNAGTTVYMTDEMRDGKTDQNCCQKTTMSEKEQINSVNHHLPKKAPIVGWQNGSPTVFPSSPNKSPGSDVLSGRSNYFPSESYTSSRTSGIYQDTSNTEDLSSIADERLLETTPSYTIGRSVASLTPDKDTFLTTSPEIGRSKDISIGDELVDKVNLLSPETDCTEDRVLPTSPENCLTATGLTRKDNSNEKSITNDITRNSVPSRELLLKEDKIRFDEDKLAVAKATITSNPGYRLSDSRDSIDSDSILDLEEANEKENKKPKVPDGGWGWVVVASSLVISMIADGVSFSFGLLYIEFLQEFGASKAKTAWIGSLFMAVPLLSGPVMSALVDRYGCRNMTIAGGLISGIGFVLSCFSNTIEVMYLTFGVIAGLGLGLCYVTAVVSIAYWFDKKRTLAVGLGACGTGIGTFVYAPMTTFFIEEYGWRGTVLLLAGTFFNMIVCGAVMRDPEWWILEQRKQTSGTPKKSIARSECGRSSGSPTDEFPGVDELRRLLKNGQAPEYLLQSLSTSTAAPNGTNNNDAFRSAVNLPTFIKQSEKVPLEVLESLSTNSRLYNVILENYPSLLRCRSLSDKKLNDSSAEMGNKSGVTMSMRIKQAPDNTKSGSPPPKTTSPEPIKESTKSPNIKKLTKVDSEEANPLLAKELAQALAEARRAKSVSKQHIGDMNGTVIRTDSLPLLRRQFNTNTHYFKDIRVHRNSVMYRGAALNLNKYRLRASSCPNIYRNSMTTLAKESEEKWYTELVDLLKGMVDFSMFLEFHFLLMSLSTILLFTWFIVPYFYLAEHLTRNGYTETDAANLLSIIGITNTIGMIGLGWAGDQPWMNVSKTFSWCLAACGLATVFMSICTKSYILLMVTSAAFGLFFASSFSFTPVILVELIPLERFTTAYGLTLLCQGIGNLLGPPLAGWLFDVTESWDLSFYMAGGWIMVAGLLVGMIPYTKNRKIWGDGPMEMERERESLA